MARTIGDAFSNIGVRLMDSAEMERQEKSKREYEERLERQRQQERERSEAALLEKQQILENLRHTNARSLEEYKQGEHNERARLRAETEQAKREQGRLMSVPLGSDLVRVGSDNSATVLRPGTQKPAASSKPVPPSQWTDSEGNTKRDIMSMFNSDIRMLENERKAAIAELGHEAMLSGPDTAVARITQEYARKVAERTASRDTQLKQVGIEQRAPAAAPASTGEAATGSFMGDAEKKKALLGNIRAYLSAAKSDSTKVAEAKEIARDVLRRARVPEDEWPEGL